MYSSSQLFVAHKICEDTYEGGKLTVEPHSLTLRIFILLYMSCTYYTQSYDFQATLTKCNHTFCAHCLKESKKRSRTCPVCRTDRVNERRVAFVDTFITSVMKLLSDELYAGRMQLVEDRKSNYLHTYLYNYVIIMYMRRCCVYSCTYTNAYSNASTVYTMYVHC